MTGIFDLEIPDEPIFIKVLLYSSAPQQFGDKHRAFTDLLFNANDAFWLFYLSDIVDFN